MKFKHPVMSVDQINETIKFNKLLHDQEISGPFHENKISDGYHTFDELYEFRKLYHAGFANMLAQWSDIEVYKSYHHSDGLPCFGGGWFIVVIVLPQGQITNHYKNSDWDLFQIPEEQVPPHQYDGHTSHDVINRLHEFILSK